MNIAECLLNPAEFARAQQMADGEIRSALVHQMTLDKQTWYSLMMLAASGVRHMIEMGTLDEPTAREVMELIQQPFLHDMGCRRVLRHVVAFEMARGMKKQADAQQEMDASMLTYMGIDFHPFAPEARQILPYDLAKGLSNLCRYSGQIGQFYSVAQHSVALSSIVPQEFALEALLHDAAEAYIGDLITPLKHLEGMARYREAERRIGVAVSARFELRQDGLAEITHNHDLLYRAERAVLGPFLEPADKDKVEAKFGWLTIELNPRSPEEAEEEWLERLDELWTPEGGRIDCSGPPQRYPITLTPGEVPAPRGPDSARHP